MSDRIDDLSTGLKRNENRESEKVDRTMRIWFGAVLLVLTTFFTLAFMWVSYLIAMHVDEGWEAPEVAITALMIAAPIQFVVLMCVIASCVMPRRKETAAPGGASQGEDAK